MLRLMVLLLIQLQRPLPKRDLDDFPKTTQEFVRYTRPRNNFLDRWLGFSSTELEDDDNNEKLSDEYCGDEDSGDEDSGDENSGDEN